MPLFLSQAFSVTLYAFGLAESLRIVWPGVPVELAAFVIVAAVGILAFKGANAALKAQIPLMVLIVMAIAALAVGVLRGHYVADPVPVAAPAAKAVGFWVVFAVFFPAVTGVMAGLGLSGDLRNPGKAIPLGAIAATLTGFVIYLGVPFLLHAGANPQALKDPLIWTRIAPLGAWLVVPGLWGAIFSSAVGSALGAPRTLQALAMDELAPKMLAGKQTGEPILGLIGTVAIALGAVLLGNLNAVAPVVSMFFLTVYGMVNLVAALETLSGDASWRPKIRVPWLVSLVGALGSFAVMFLIDAKAAAAAIAVEIALWLWLGRRERRAEWGDARRGMYEALIRWSLLRLSRRPMTARSWRPHILTFVDDVERHLDLVRFGTWFSQGRGVVTVCELVVGDLLDVDLDARTERLTRVLDREGLIAFGEVDAVDEALPGIASVMQANGIAGLDSNTALLGWPREAARMAELLQVVRRLEKLHKSAIVARVQPGLLTGKGKRRREIHVWWGGLQRNGDLMLLLAHLLTRNPEWRGAKIRVMSLASNEHMKGETERHLGRFLPEIRIDAEVTVQLRPEGQTVREMIQSQSADADLVFLGLSVPEAGGEAKAAEQLEAMAEGLRSVFFVKNSSPFGGELVTPD